MEGQGLHAGAQIGRHGLHRSAAGLAFAYGLNDMCRGL
jgi:hypothetical protein